MKIEKQKTYSNISLEEVKEHLNIYSGDTSYDSILQRLIKSATEIVENDIGQDIATTVATLTDYCIHSNCYTIFEPNVVISGITATTESGSVSVITGYSTYSYSSYTHVKFDNSVNAETLQIQYSSGMATVPESLKSAIFIKLGELFNDRDGYTTNNFKETKAYNRIIAKYTNLI